MRCDFQLTGADRKPLVKIIGDFLGVEAKYMRVPTCAYQIGDYNVSKEGILTGEDNEELLQAIIEAGFTYEETERPQEAEQESPAEVRAEQGDVDSSICMPVDMFNETSLGNLKALIQAKGTLMKRAFQIERLDIEVGEETVKFPWFSTEDPEELAAYTFFIQKICEMAVNRTRISPKEKEIVNEKYEFRCFLLSLGMIGEDTKKIRKFLMKNLSGSSAFKNGQKEGG